MKLETEPKGNPKINHRPNKDRFRPFQNRSPLTPVSFLELALGSIKANGWLQAQLIKMKTGMTGHLDELYSEVLGSRNGWLGGDGDVWERGPYWLDGLVPLAYILEDEELIQKALPWIEWTIASQKSDGFFGPESSAASSAPEEGLQKNLAEDWWPRMIMLKVLKQYYSATGDERIIDFMTAYFHYQLRQLPLTPLDHWSSWGSQRGGDNLMMVHWLYNLTGDAFLLELGEIIHKQTYDWAGSFKEEKISRLFSFHGVNLAQGIKEPVVYYQQAPEKKYLELVDKAFKDIEKYIGQPQGMYGADELTHTNEPTQGSELCSAVEMMFSLETIMTITGKVKYMDLLEKIAYNALPAQISKDFGQRQYYQQANQVMISRHLRNFITAYDGTEQCFGLLTGFPCCTCNMHQGWPKFTQNLWMATPDGGIAALLYAPSDVETQTTDGDTIRFLEETNYPFDEVVHFTYKGKNQKIAFPFYLRIPAWCKEATVMLNGKPFKKARGGRIIQIHQTWSIGDKVSLQMPMEITLPRWKENSISVERGPLVYALKIGEDWQKINSRDQYGDFYEVYPTTPWNYGLLEISADKIQQSFEVIKRKPVFALLWNQENAAIEIKATAVRLPHWKLYNGNTGHLPYSPQPLPPGQEPETITLIPYGCTTLRISVFPVVSY